VNVFGLRDNLIKDYSTYIGSFITTRDERIKRIVDDHLEQGALWPDPLLQLNPSFERGATMDELVTQGGLSKACRGIFRMGKVQGCAGRMLHLHLHQEQAIRTAATGANYVLTTGRDRRDQILFEGVVDQDEVGHARVLSVVYAAGGRDDNRYARLGATDQPPASTDSESQVERRVDRRREPYPARGRRGRGQKRPLCPGNPGKERYRVVIQAS